MKRTAVQGLESEQVAAWAENRIAELMGVINAATAELVSVTAKVIESETWGGGPRSPAHWLAWKAGLSPARSRSLRAMAGRLPELPVTAVAFAEGRLTEDTVKRWSSTYAPATRHRQTCTWARRCRPPPAAASPAMPESPVGAGERGSPGSWGRNRRTVDPVLRTLIEERDRGCRAPWCTQTRWLEVHHLVHVEDGGQTTEENLACLCPRVHALHHQGVLGIRGDPPGGGAGPGHRHGYVGGAVGGALRRPLVRLAVARD